MKITSDNSKTFLISALATYGVGWTIIESISFFLSSAEVSGASRYLLLVGLSICVGLWRAWPLGKVEIPIANSDTTVVISFGSLFATETHIAVPVNEYFDSLLGDHVARTSVHGQFIQNTLGGQSTSFDQLVQDDLSGVACEDVARTTGNCRAYKIGTTAVANISDRKYFLVAFAKTDIQTLKASASVHELWDALAGLWDRVRISSNGEAVAIPLIGGGLSGIGLPPAHLLNLILESILVATKKQKITGTIHIVLPENLKQDIDLKRIKQMWR